MTSKVCRKCQQTICVYQFRSGCSWCRECERIASLARYHDNKEASQRRNKAYKEANREKVNETRRAYVRLQMLDPIERLKRNMKSLISTKIKKTKHTNEYLGTKIEDIVKWLEWNFTEEMTWSNHGKVWQIDHTLPVAAFDLTNTDDCMVCFNWMNMMPMLSKRNQSKSARILPIRVFHQERQLREYFRQSLLGTCNLEAYLQKYTQSFQKILKHATHPNCGNTLKFKRPPPDGNNWKGPRVMTGFKGNTV